MVTRVATYAARQAMITRTLESQARMQEAQIQATTEKKSLDYAGYGVDSFRLISLETDVSRLDRYIDNNKIIQTSLKAMMSSVEMSDTVIRDMRTRMLDMAAVDFRDLSPQDEQSIEDIQTFAFQALKELQFAYNLEIEGRHLFSGGRTNITPFQFNYSTLEEFQNTFDGINTLAPQSRAATLSNAVFDDIEVAYSNTSFTGIKSAVVRNVGDLSFDDAGSTITSTDADAFAPFNVGDTINITGTENNDQGYTISAISPDGKTITVSPAPNAAEEIAEGERDIDLILASSRVSVMTGAADDFITASMDDAVFGSLSFDASSGTLLSSQIGAFDSLSQGMTLLIDGVGGNAGVYTVQSVSGDGRTLTLEPPPAADGTVASGGSASIGITVPDGTTLFMTNSSNGHTDAYTVHWPTNAQLTAQGFDPTTGDVVDGSRLFVTPPFEAFSYDDTDFGDLTFTAAAGTIDASIGTAFSSFEVGQSFEVTGTVSNDGVYTITNIAGSTLTVTPAPGTDETFNAGGGATVTETESMTLAAKPYYRGDELQISQRIEENRQLQTGITANEPAIEKAVRALMIIAQGDLGNHPERVTEGLELLNQAIQSTTDSSELRGDLNSLVSKLGINQKIVDNTIEEQEEFLAFLDIRRTELENVNVTEAIVRLQDEANALEVAFSALARIQQLSLSNYI